VSWPNGRKFEDNRRLRVIATRQKCEPEWRNWQTRQVEGLVAFTGSAGSSPVSGNSFEIVTGRDQSRPAPPSALMSGGGSWLSNVSAASKA
jgi:hypothetical protein